MGKRGHLLAGWLLTVGTVSAGVYQLGFGHGVARTALMLVLLGGGLLFEWGSGRTEPLATGGSALWSHALMALAALGFAYHLYAGAVSIAETRDTGYINLDQGQDVYRAIVLLPEGLNPYGRHTLLDPIYYIKQIEKWGDSDCVSFPIPRPASPVSAQEQQRWIEHMLSTVTGFWHSLELAKMRKLMPRIDGAPRCDAARFGFESLGFKYGPGTIAPYVPGVWLFGKSGIFVVQLLCFVGICAAVLAWCVGRSPRRPELWSVALVVVLCTPHLLNNMLETSALDGPPTLFALLGLCALFRKSPVWGAFFMGLSLASKPLPGLLYAPALAKTNARGWMVFAGAAILPYLPFALWDARGLLNNVVLYSLTRDTDSTALAHYLPTWGRLTLLAVVGYALLWVWRRTQREGWNPLSTTRFIFMAHLGVLIASGYLHNNYMTWLSPVVALYTFQITAADRKRA